MYNFDQEETQAAARVLAPSMSKDPRTSGDPIMVELGPHSISWYPGPDQIATYVEGGLISCETLASGNSVLAIYSYTERCQALKMWDEVTRRCRGLILELDTGNLVARPFDKFFDLGEMPETEFDSIEWNQEYVVTEKYDGVLGIIFHHANSWNIATYWAFDSLTSGFARDKLLPELAQDRLDPEYTYLVEIIKRGVQVGVLINDFDALILLGRRHIRSGRLDWPTELADIADVVGLMPPKIYSPAMPLRDYVVNVKRDFPGREGVVVRFADGLMLKVVTDEYCRLFSAIHGD